MQLKLNRLDLKGVGYPPPSLVGCLSTTNLFLVHGSRYLPGTSVLRSKHCHWWDSSGTPFMRHLTSSQIDEYALIPSVREGDSVANPYLRFADPNVTPEIYDMPIGLVNRILYSRPTDNFTIWAVFYDSALISPRIFPYWSPPNQCSSRRQWNVETWIYLVKMIMFRSNSRDFLPFGADSGPPPTKERIFI